MSGSNGKTPPRGRGGVFRGSAGGGLLPSTRTTTSNVLSSSSAAALLFSISSDRCQGWYWRWARWRSPMSCRCQSCLALLRRSLCARIARCGRTWAAAGGASLCKCDCWSSALRIPSRLRSGCLQTSCVPELHEVGPRRRKGAIIKLHDWDQPPADGERAQRGPRIWKVRRAAQELRSRDRRLLVRWNSEGEWP
jgi:hypothetical protein